MPNRFIKESIRGSESIDVLTWFEEVLFYRLIVSCDDFGRFDGRAKMVLHELFPLKDEKSVTEDQVEVALHSLASQDLIRLYVNKGKRYLFIPSWGEHQQTRAIKSKYPDPEESQLLSDDNSLITSDNKCYQVLSNAKQEITTDNTCARIRIRNSINDIRNTIFDNDNEDIDNNNISITETGNEESVDKDTPSNNSQSTETVKEQTPKSDTSRKDKSPIPPPPYEEILKLYNEILKGRLNEALGLTEERKAQISARWKKHPSIEFFKTYFERVGKNEFLCGANANGWKADFDWLMDGKNMLKFHEGKFDDYKPPGEDGGSFQTEDFVSMARSRTNAILEKYKTKKGDGAQ